MTTPQSRPQSEYLSEFSNAMWTLEKDRVMRTTGTVVWVLDKLPDRAVITDRIERLSRMVLGFRHRLMPPTLGLATPRWVVDPNFDVSDHLVWIGAPPPMTVDAVLEYARQSSMFGLDMGRAPWTMTVVDGIEGGRAAVVYKFHHVLMDGGGLLQMFSLIFDPQREPPELGPMPPAPVASDGEPSALELARDELAHVGEEVAGVAVGAGLAAVRGLPHALTHPRSAVSAVLSNVTALTDILRPRMNRLSPIMIDRRGWWRVKRFEVDFSTFHTAAKALGGTINDAVLAGVGTGFALYHEAHGAPLEKIRVALAINVRRPEDPPFGNQISSGFVDIPVSTHVDPRLIAEYHDLVLANRADADQPLADALGAVLGRLGPPLARAILRHGEVVISHVRGPDIAYFCGAEILEFCGFGPPMGLACNVSMLTYHNTCNVGVNVDAAAVPDVDFFVDCLEQGFHQVLGYAEGGDQ